MKCYINNFSWTDFFGHLLKVICWHPQVTFLSQSHADSSKAHCHFWKGLGQQSDSIVFRARWGPSADVIYPSWFHSGPTYFWDHCDQFTFPWNNQEPWPCGTLPELRQEAREITYVRFCCEQNRIKFFFIHYTLSFLCTLLKFRLRKTSLRYGWKHLNLMYYPVKKLRQNDLLSRHGYFCENLQ